MYAVYKEDLDAVLRRAGESGAQMLVHFGDMCNDYAGSPEVINAYLDNIYGLPVYGLYGNHELETPGNTMSYVTPRLTNRPDSAVWGTGDGKMSGGGSPGYYYFDIGGAYRFIMLDTNYSFDPVRGVWEHNRTASWGAPAGNLHENSLGPDQLEWLGSALGSAAGLGLRCVVCSHAAFAGKPESKLSPDWRAVRELFRSANSSGRNNVIAAFNGHYHSDSYYSADGVLYFDTNAARNGFWAICAASYYKNGETFDFTDYDAEGRPAGTVKKELAGLIQGQNTCYFEKPLSAMVTLSEGGIEIRGLSSRWLYGIVPDGYDPAGGRITSLRCEYGGGKCSVTEIHPE